MSTTVDLTAAFSGLDAQITRVFDVMMGKTPVLNGPPGPTGPNGPTGPMSATGPRGATGLAGPAGVTGLGLGTTIRGVWSSELSYSLNGGTNPDSVTYNGSLFACIAAVTSPSPPDVDTAHWLRIVAQGATGSVSSVGTDGQFLYNNAGIVAGANFVLYRATGPTGPTGGATGPRAPTVQVAAYVVPTTDGTYDLGATGIQFKDVHFSGSIYNNGTPFQGGVSGLVYRATGPTGPTGGATGPRAPTLQTAAHILPTTDLTFDLGATGLRFRDIYVGGSSIYMGDSVVLTAPNGNLNITSGGITSQLGTNPSGSYKDPLTNVTVTGPIFSMGATGSAGPIILQAGLSATHVLETYTATGPNWAYSQTKTQPGTYEITSIYGPSGPDFNNNGINYIPHVSFNSARGYATGPTGLQDGDIMGAVIFQEKGALRGVIYANKVGPTGSSDSALNVTLGGSSYLTITSTGPTRSGLATGPVGPNIALAAHMYPTTDATYNLGATGYQFKDVHFSGSLYNNGVPFSGGGAATYPVGSYKDPLTNVTVTGPILSMGATGSAGPIILQAGLSPNHVLESYTATGPNLAFSQTKTQPGSYTVNTVYGPSGPDLANNSLIYIPQITFNTSRGYATGPTGLQNGDIMGTIIFKENNTTLGLIGVSKIGPTDSTDVSLTITAGATMIFTSTGPIGPDGGPTGPVGPNIALSGHMYPSEDLAFDLGATGFRFRDIHVGGSSIYMGDSVVLSASATDFSVTTEAGTTSLASATYVPPPPVASAFTPLGAGTTANCIQPQTGTAYAGIFTHMATSANGQYITVIGPGDGSVIYTKTLIMTSSNSGATFTSHVMVSGNSSVYAVAVSESGKYQIVVENDPGKFNSAIFVSSNYGVTWTEVWLNGGCTADFASCAVSETSPNGTPIFVAGGLTQVTSDETPSFIYCRGVPSSFASWAPRVTTYTNPATTNFSVITSVRVSDDGTRLIVLDKGTSGTKTLICYQITSGAVTKVAALDIFNIDITYASLTNPIISNIRSNGGFTLIAQTASGVGADIYSFQYTWSSPGSSPVYTNGSARLIDSNSNGFMVPSQIVTSADGTYQFAICVDTTAGDIHPTNTYISSNSGASWSLIAQNSVSPFNSLNTIAMSSDASITYCLSQADLTLQALRTSLSVGSYAQTTPTAALTYRATGPTGPTGGATGPRAPTTQISSHFLPTTNATYDLGATGIQFKDVHFSGSLYNNGTPFSGGGGGGGTTGLTYRATGPTGPTGGATGPAPEATIQIGTHLVPDKDLTYDLGATGLRFRDMYVGGSTIYLGDTVTLSGSAGTLSVNSAPLMSSTTVPNTGAGGIGVTFSKILEYPDISGIIQTTPGTISMSANGQYISYITGDRTGTTGYIYVSSNYGASFAKSPSDGYSTNTATNAAHGIPMTNLYFSAIAVSSTGQYQTALEYNGGIFCSSDYGQTWRETFAYTWSSTENNWVVSNTTGFGYNLWGGVCISSDGKIQVVWNIGLSSSISDPTMYISNNKIPTTNTDWLQTYTFDVGSNSDIILQCCMSASGDRIIALSGAYTSSYVTTYYIDMTAIKKVTQINLNGTGNGRRFDTITINSTLYLFSNISIQLSSDGSRIGIFARYVNGSDNLGASIRCSWGSANSVFSIIGVNTIMSAYFGSPLKLSMSSDGAVQVVSFGLTNDIPGMYISYNYGVTWSTILNLAALKVEFNFTSANGSYINAFNFSSTNAINQCSSFYQCHSTTPTLTFTNIPYTPTTSGDWPTALVPTTMGGALDTIAKFLKSSYAATWPAFS